MGMQQRKWGDRRDAIWLKELPPLNRIMPGIMPNRADNEAFIQLDIDLGPLDTYLAEKNAGRETDKYTYFHVISAAIARAFVLRPRMNRFICNRRVYQRRELSVAFVVKKQFNDRSEEGLAFLRFEDTETMDSYHGKIMNTIHATRREDTLDTSSNAMDILNKLPQFLLNWIVDFILWLDKHGWCPDALIGTDPNHASIFLSNLGSIGLEGGYHHLVNWGTNSCFVVLGKKQLKMQYQSDGSGQLRQVIPLGITLDERIADGYYYSGTVALVKELLANPRLLDMPANTPVEYSIKR